MVVPIALLVGIIAGGAGCGIGLGVSALIRLLRKSDVKTKTKGNENRNVNIGESTAVSQRSLPPPPPSDCSICMEQLKPPLLVTPCDHIFHQNCAWRWFQKRLISHDRLECANCRKVIPSECESHYFEQLETFSPEEDENSEEINLAQLMICGRCKRGLIQPFDRLPCEHAYHRICLRKALWTSFLLQGQMTCEICDEPLPDKLMAEYFIIFLNDVGNYLRITKVFWQLADLLLGSENVVRCDKCEERVNDDVIFMPCDHVFHKVCFYELGWVSMVEDNENRGVHCPVKDCNQVMSQSDFFKEFAEAFLKYFNKEGEDETTPNVETLDDNNEDKENEEIINEGPKEGSSETPHAEVYKNNETELKVEATGSDRNEEKLSKEVLLDLIQGLMDPKKGKEFETESACPLCENKMTLNSKIVLPCGHAMHRSCFWPILIINIQEGEASVCPLSYCKSEIPQDIFEVIFIQMQEDCEAAKETMESETATKSLIDKYVKK